MRQRTAILLIGAILTVGLSLVVGVGVVDVSAADTLVVDQDGTAEYSSIQTAIDDASAGDTVEIRPGTYAETIVVDKNITVTAPDGATLDGTDVDSPDAGITIRGFDSENVEPTIRGLTITRYETGIESTTDGNWVVSDVTIRIVQGNGISASSSSGDWTVRDSEIESTGGNGIRAAKSDGEWVVEDTVVRRTDFAGIEAGSTLVRSSADWTIRNVSVDGSIDARDSDGNWVIEQSTVQDDGVGVFTSDSNGKWEIRQSIITGDVPIRAEDTLGEWRVSQSIINETSTSSFESRIAIVATDTIAEGIATDNWWGSPSGPDENACVGNVDCSDPLTTRPSDVGYNPDDGDESTPTPTPTPTPTITAVDDFVQVGGTAKVSYILNNVSDQSSVELTTTDINRNLRINESASDFAGGNIEDGGERIIYSQPSQTVNPTIVYDVSDTIALPTIIGSESTLNVTVALLNENSTVTDTDTAIVRVQSNTPSTPGEVTPLTSDNPSPNENRGAFAGVTPYTTADDVLGGIGNDAVIFQGEEDIVFERTDGTEVNPATLERTAGDNEGVTLSLPIPDDQAEGGYSVDPGDLSAYSVTVQEPRVTTLEVQDNTERDVSGDILELDQNNASVFIEYNYEEAENIELTVESENGLDVTGEALDIGEVDNKNADPATPSGSAPDGSVRFELNPSNLDEGQYTFTVAGVEDLVSGEATQSVTTTIRADQTASLSLSEDEAVQGSDTIFTVENSPEGEFHPVVIDESEFRDGVSLDQAEDVFRNVGDTVETGVADSTGPGATDITDVEYAYAIVEIDGGDGVGSVETQFLKTNSTTIELYPSDGATPIESHPPGVVFTTQDPGMTATANFTLANQDQEQPIVSEYAGEDGGVGPFDVIEAIDDFRQQELGPFEVLEIIEALRG